ncbi:LysM peptidoglycan-binding domain-containing protein, partial [Raineyella sp.]|uniref:LysM peptidoglycan-binding domain-containing protein n=1 Tax=Raineyella sp. TaxID=1911550 RepID=UPI002B20DF9B
MNPPPRHPRLVGLAAFVALVALLVGLPAVLLALGWGPTPSGLGGWWAALTSRDDGHLTVLILKVAAWVVWGLLAVTILTEAIAALRGLEPPKLPGLQWSQAPARRLVTAALLLFIAVPATGIETASAVPGSPSPVATATASVAPAPSASVGTPRAVALVETAPAPVTHTVKRGETLWSIAEHHLGSGSRYPEILKLNNNLLRGKAQFLRPGWVLTLPAVALAPAGQATATRDHAHSLYTVVKGDTLSEIAQQHLDDAEAWPRIFEATRGIPQPDGRRLTDPDLILPGWHLLIPAAAEATPDLPTSPEPERAEPSSRISPSSPDASAPPTTLTPTPVAETSPATERAIPVPVAPSSAPAAPSPSASATVATDVAKDKAPASGATDQDAEAPVPWLLVGLTGAGGVLAAGLLATLRQRRRAQFRARRPGRTIQAPPPELVPVEKTVMTEGQAATPDLLAI